MSEGERVPLAVATAAATSILLHLAAIREVVRLLNGEGVSA